MHYTNELTRQTIKLILDHSGYDDQIVKAPFPDTITMAHDSVKNKKYRHIKYALFDLLIKNHAPYYEELAEKEMEKVYTQQQLQSMKDEEVKYKGLHIA
jgi:hypothetical protein